MSTISMCIMVINYSLHLFLLFLATQSSGGADDFRFIFFLPLTFVPLRSVSAVSNTFYLLLFFSILLPLFLGFFQCNPSSQFRSSLPHFPLHFLGIDLLSLPVFHLQFFPHDQPMSTYSSPIFLKTPSFQPTLSVHPLFSYRSHNTSYQVVFSHLDCLLLYLC